MQIYKKTKSLCPKCREILITDIIEKDGSMWMKKTCPRHGKFEIKIAKYAWYYKGLDSYYNNLFDENDFKKNNPIMMYSTFITSECNLRCPICFSESPGSEYREIPLGFFKKQLEKIKKRDVIITFSGGEPTLNKNLPKLINLVKNSGRSSLLLTNGIKIANDFEYLEKLKKSGLTAVGLSMETINNPEIDIKIRGGDFRDLKIRALKNMNKLNIPIEIYAVIAKNINESEISRLIELAKKEDAVFCLRFLSYFHIGRAGLSTEQEFLPDEFTETIAKQSNNLFTLKDIFCQKQFFYALNAILGRPPSCSRYADIFIPRGKEFFPHRIFTTDKFLSVLDKFKITWRKNREKAKIYFLLKILPEILTTPGLYSFRRAINKIKIPPETIPPFQYLRLTTISHFNLTNIDLEESQLKCNTRSIDYGVENNICQCYARMFQKNFLYENLEN